MTGDVHGNLKMSPSLLADLLRKSLPLFSGSTHPNPHPTEENRSLHRFARRIVRRGLRLLSGVALELQGRFSVLVDLAHAVLPKRTARADGQTNGAGAARTEVQVKHLRVSAYRSLLVTELVEKTCCSHSFRG